MRTTSRSYSNFFDMVRCRRTTYEFSSKKVKNSDINKILEAARWAPSTSNIQPWHFIVVQDKKKISALIDSASYGAFHTDPPLIIALVLLDEHWVPSEHRGVKNNRVGTAEAYLCLAMPALIMVFEAQELGINSALVTPELKASSKILKLKGNNICPLMLCLGYEAN